MAEQIADGSYAWEMLYLATKTLATGREPLMVRLAHALFPHLLSLQSEEDFPWPDLRYRFSCLMANFVPASADLGAILVGMSEFDLIRIAQEIADLHDSVAWRVGSME
jgi:hypothetical protein